MLFVHNPNYEVSHLLDHNCGPYTEVNKWCSLKHVSTETDAERMLHCGPYTEFNKWCSLKPVATETDAERMLHCGPYTEVNKWCSLKPIATETDAERMLHFFYIYSYTERRKILLHIFCLMGTKNNGLCNSLDLLLFAPF
jgi:hypothetical protein